MIKEAKEAITKSLPYLLSHHDKEQYDRCHILKIGKRNIVVCARCLGVYLGIILTIMFFFHIILNDWLYFYLIMAPIPTLFDQIDCFEGVRHMNVIRTLSGFLLGSAYVLGMASIIYDKDLITLLLGIFYAIIALLFIRNEKHCNL